MSDASEEILIEAMLESERRIAVIERILQVESHPDKKRFDDEYIALSGMVSFCLAHKFWQIQQNHKRAEATRNMIGAGSNGEETSHIQHFVVPDSVLKNLGRI